MKVKFTDFIKIDNFAFSFIYYGMVVKISGSNMKSAAGSLLELDRIFSLLKRGRLGACGFYIEFSKFLEGKENLRYFFHEVLFHYDFLYSDGLERFYDWAIKQRVDKEELKRVLVKIKEESLNHYCFPANLIKTLFKTIDGDYCRYDIPFYINYVYEYDDKFKI